MKGQLSIYKTTILVGCGSLHGTNLLQPSQDIQHCKYLFPTTPLQHFFVQNPYFLHNKILRVCFPLHSCRSWTWNSGSLDAQHRKCMMWGHNLGWVSSRLYFVRQKGNVRYIINYINHQNVRCCWLVALLKLVFKQEQSRYSTYCRELKFWIIWAWVVCMMYIWWCMKSNQSWNLGWL